MGFSNYRGSTETIKWNVFISLGEELKQSSRMSRLASTCRKSTTSLDNAEGELSETSTTNDDDETFEDFFVAVSI